MIYRNVMRYLFTSFILTLSLGSRTKTFLIIQIERGQRQMASLPCKDFFDNIGSTLLVTVLVH